MMATTFPLPTHLFLNNEYVPSTLSPPQTFLITSPFTRLLLPAAIHCASTADIDTAVTHASHAFRSGPWSTYTGSQRAKCLLKFADLLEENAGEIAYLDAVCMGVLVGINAGFFVVRAAEVYRYYAGWADKISGESFAAEDGTYKIVSHEPYGVCAAIASWNTPILYIAWKIAAGNTCIFKASEKAPLSSLALGRLVVEAGFPPGVIQFVNGGKEAGAALASHMKIQKISFTGSTTVGKIISQLALKSNMKNATLELGGKSAAIVFADADIPNAVGSTADGFLINSSQVCVAASRLLIQASIAGEFIEAVKARFVAIESDLGADPLLLTTVHGPMVDEKHLNTVMSFIEAGKGGNFPLIGGSRKEEKSLFIQPTIFVNPDKSSKVYREEIFGPVLTILTFETEEEAIELANDTVTGLSA